MTTLSDADEAVAREAAWRAVAFGECVVRTDRHGSRIVDGSEFWVHKSRSVGPTMPWHDLPPMVWQEWPPTLTPIARAVREACCGARMRVI